MQHENDCIANFTKTLKHFWLQICICHDVSKLGLEIPKHSYKTYSYEFHRINTKTSLKYIKLNYVLKPDVPRL